MMRPRRTFLQTLLLRAKRLRRRGAGLAVWLATPWRMPARLRARRCRGLPLAAFANDPATIAPPDFGDDAEIRRCVGGSVDAVHWPTIAATAITDASTAAQWILGLLRSRADLRLQFPRALSAGAQGGFARWLADEGAAAFDLPEAARALLAEAFSRDLSARARQYYFWRDDLRADLPLALLPPGRRGLTAMMLRHREEGQLRLEEVWWFFLETAEDPARELVRSYLFTPSWQRAHPAGLTIFGRDRLAAWLIEQYGLACHEAWLDPAQWPVSLSPEEEIRLAYAAHGDWRAARPDAFATPAAAAGLLAWLGSDASGLAVPVRAWCARRSSDGTAARLARVGANIIGHYCYPSGLRVSVEAMAAAIETEGGGVSRRDIRTDLRDEPRHVEVAGLGGL